MPGGWIGAAQEVVCARKRGALRPAGAPLRPLCAGQPRAPPPPRLPQVREYTGKRLLREAMKRIAGVELPINVAQVRRALPPRPRAAVSAPPRRRAAGSASAAAGSAQHGLRMLAQLQPSIRFMMQLR